MIKDLTMERLSWIMGGGGPNVITRVLIKREGEESESEGDLKVLCCWL